PWSVLYLAIAGSLLGFACYFFIIKELGATAVAMVTLMTPVFALALGAFFNGEHISEVMLIGTACILSGLVLYYWSASERKLDKHKNSESVEVAG
ncbi:DMT family transporter, partial [Oleiphilus sp. HI0086]